jgi:hypothetical protein
MALGARSYTYKVVDGWGRGPGCPTLGLISAVGIDSQDQVYLFNRLPQPAVLVFDREGRYQLTGLEFFKGSILLDYLITLAAIVGDGLNDALNPRARGAGKR